MIKWTDMEALENEKAFHPIDVMGGFMFSDRKDIYLSTIQGEFPDAAPYIAELIPAIEALEIKCSGNQHQFGKGFAPLFDDGHFLCFTFRAWGDLMTAIWGGMFSEWELEVPGHANA